LGRRTRRPRSHMAAILANANFKLVAACDTDKKKISQWRSDWRMKCPTYSSVSKMLSSTYCDVIVLAAPADIQSRLLKLIIQKKPKIIFCEKPFCFREGDARSIQILAKKNRVPIVINYQRRFDDKIRKLKNYIGHQKTPFHITVTYYKGLYNYGSHLIDLLVFLFGKIVMVCSEPVGPWQDRRKDPSVSAVLFFTSGFKANFIGIDKVNYELCEVEIFFQNQKYLIEMGGYAIRKQTARKSLYFKDYVNLKKSEPLLLKGPINGLTNAYKEISRYIRTGKSAISCVADDAIYNHKILKAIVTSAQTGKAIHL